MSKINRRHLLGAGAVGSVALAMPSIVRAQAEPIKIGTVLPNQGAFAQHARSASLGFKVALEQVGNKVHDRPVQLIAYDDPSPLGAQQNARKLVSEDKVVAIIGGQNSATGLALHSLAQQMKVPTVLTVPIVKDITGKNCDPHVFRVQALLDVYTSVIAPLVLERGKRFYQIYGAYAFGQEAYQVMKAQLEPSGGVEVGSDSVPVGTTDFSAYILKIRQARPDTIVTSLAGNDLAAFCKQLGEFGQKIPTFCPIASQDDLWAQSWPDGHLEFTGGVFWQYNNPANSPAEAELYNASMKATGAPPSQSAAMPWIAMRMLLESLDKAKSLSAPDIVDALEHARVAGTPAYFREWDHQLMWPIPIVRVKDKVANKYDILDTVKTTTMAEIEKLSGSQADSQCHMKKA